MTPNPWFTPLSLNALLISLSPSIQHIKPTASPSLGPGTPAFLMQIPHHSFWKTTTTYLSTCIIFTFWKHIITTPPKPFNLCLHNTKSPNLLCILYPFSTRTFQGHVICAHISTTSTASHSKYSPCNTLWAKHHTNLLNLTSLQHWIQSSYPLYQPI